MASLQAELDDLAKHGFLDERSITDGALNYQSKLHARMLGALARAVKRPLVPLIEVKWNRGFCPDLCVIDNTNRVLAVVEYESTNSSDERLVGKDLFHFEKAIKKDLKAKSLIPMYWIVISTLPDCLVTGWPWWTWNTLKKYPPKVKDRKLRNRNPCRYYESGLHKACRLTWQQIAGSSKGSPRTNLAWINMGADRRLTVKNLNGKPQR